jgi:hypothetical protein
MVLLGILAACAKCCDKEIYYGCLNQSEVDIHKKAAQSSRIDMTVSVSVFKMFMIDSSVMTVMT